MPAVPPQGGHGDNARDFYGGDHQTDKKDKKEKKDKGHGTGALLAAGAGGLAVGALAGAALADDSDDGEFC